MAITSVMFRLGDKYQAGTLLAKGKSRLEVSSLPRSIPRTSYSQASSLCSTTNPIHRHGGGVNGTRELKLRTLRRILYRSAQLNCTPSSSCQVGGGADGTVEQLNMLDAASCVQARVSLHAAMARAKQWTPWKPLCVRGCAKGPRDTRTHGVVPRVWGDCYQLHLRSASESLFCSRQDAGLGTYQIMCIECRTSCKGTTRRNASAFSRFSRMTFQRLHRISSCTCDTLFLSYVTLQRTVKSATFGIAQVPTFCPKPRPRVRLHRGIMKATLFPDRSLATACMSVLLKAEFRFMVAAGR